MDQIRWIEGILYREGYVLIAKLRYPNSLIPRLEWTFPFAPLPAGESPRFIVQKMFKERFGLTVDQPKHLSKVVPSENSRIEKYIYHVSYVSGNPTSQTEFSEFMWVKPTQVLKYFTTSMSRDVMNYLRELESNNK